MKRKHIDFETSKQTWLKDPKFKEAYDQLQPEYELIRAIMDARIKQGMSQEDLATKIGTKQAVISRIETGKANPSIMFLKRLTLALNASLEIHLVQK